MYHFCLQVHLLESQVAEMSLDPLALIHLSQKITLLLPQSLEYFDSHPQPETCLALAKIRLKKKRVCFVFAALFFSLLYSLLIWVSFCRAGKMAV